MSGFESSLGWVNGTMDGAAATLQVATAGVHTLNVWMREDGFAFDKLILSADPTYLPGDAPRGADNAGGTASGPALLLPSAALKAVALAAR